MGHSTLVVPVEVDLGRQLLFMTTSEQTWVLNTSTGSGESYTEPDRNSGGTISGVSITPEGSYEFYRQRPEGWWEGDLGSIYRPKYIVGGIAIHGAPKIPNYPASHGCVRVSVPAMDWIWATDAFPLGTQVVIHE